MNRPPQLINNCLIYESGFAVDCDGSPRAYSNDSRSLDYLANAGHTGNWYGIATDANGEPFIQGPNDPYPGMYVSTTALQDHSRAIDDPARYVDSEKVNYVSIASNLIKQYGIHVGDICAVYYRNTNTLCSAICADVGPKNKFGEGSIALATQLGIPNNPKHGGCDDSVITIIFLHSRSTWPLDDNTIFNLMQSLLQQAGGIQKFL